MSFTSANTNPYPVTFTSMTSGTVTSSDQTNCPASNVTVANASGLSLAVPAGATTTPGTIADVVTMASVRPMAAGRHLHHRAHPHRRPDLILTKGT